MGKERDDLQRVRDFLVNNRRTVAAAFPGADIGTQLRELIDMQTKINSIDQMIEDEKSMESSRYTVSPLNI